MDKLEIQHRLDQIELAGKELKDFLLNHEDNHEELQSEIRELEGEVSSLEDERDDLQIEIDDMRKAIKNAVFKLHTLTGSDGVLVNEIESVIQILEEA